MIVGLADRSANVVNIVGGVGNQLFQYLFGRALEQATGVETRYDLSAFASYKLHGGFALERAFELQLPRWEPAAEPVVLRSLAHRQVQRVLNRFSRVPLPGRRVRVDDGVWASPVQGSAGRYYLGVWQAWPHSEAFLRAEAERLMFRAEVTTRVDAALSAMEVDLDRSAAVHVRLGDYLSGGKKCHLPLSEGFYRPAVEEMLAGGEIDRLYVFSDAIARISATWFAGLPVVFVDGYSGQNGLTDLSMLSRFRRLIVSASTFGWWGGLLAGRDAIVVAPTPWVRAEFEADPRHTPIPLSNWRLRPSSGFDLEREAPGMAQPR